MYLCGKAIHVSRPEDKAFKQVLGTPPGGHRRNVVEVPYQERYLLVYVFSWSLAIHGHSKDSSGLSDFPLNSHKKRIRPSFCPDQQHPARRQFFPFH
jgi:hypothetical protein